MSAEEIAARFADARPGLVLASFADVALPFYRLSVRVRTIEHKDVTPFEDYAMRSLAAGVESQGDIEAMLGLDRPLLEATLVGLAEQEAIELGSEQGEERQTVMLTKKGREMLRSASSIQSSEAVIEIDYDGLLREPVGFLARYLEPRQLVREGIREIPPHPARAPTEEELRGQLDRIEAIIRATGGPRRERADVLGVRSIQRRTRIFQPAVALVYRTRGAKRSQGQVAFVVAGAFSERHAEVFAKAGLAAKLGVARRGLEDGQQLAARALGKEVVDLAKSPATTEAPAVSKGSLDVNPTSGVRGVETYEHPELLRHALRSATERLVLISPWLRSAVLDKELLADFAGALDRGVELYLGWGIGGEGATGRDADAEALQSLGRLAEEHANFHFSRLGRTHAKVLICDRRFMVVTSFNWLSFKGDPKRTFRDERGLLVSLAEQIDDQFDEMIRRFEQWP